MFTLCVLCFVVPFCVVCFFFFNDTATTEIYTLSLHDALPIFACCCWQTRSVSVLLNVTCRSEEHTSELQSRQYLVCRLLLEKKKKKLRKSGHKQKKIQHNKKQLKTQRY